MWNTKLIDTARGVFEVFIKGEGQPICVTHHYTEFSEQGHYFAEPFTATHKTILVNLREAGRSVGAEGDEQLTMRETVEDLEAIREAMGYEKWAYAGTSTGGMIGLTYGIYHSGSLTFLIVAGATASRDYMDQAGCIYNSNHQHNVRVQELLAIINNPATTPEERGPAVREWTQMSIFRPEKFDDYFNTPGKGGKTHPRRLRGYINELADYDIRDSLQRIQVPTLVVCGRHDAQCPLESSEEIHRLTPGSQLAIIEESNHYPYLENPGQFNDVILAFFATCQK
ncbi:MAG: alpha/beta hydrolase [Tumebacillaceae bacterium]